MKLDEYRTHLEFAIGVPFTDGNRVVALRNGDEIFPSMLAAIRGATSHLEFLTHVYWSGDIAREFADALAEKARAGVRVRVLLDAFGAKDICRDCLNILESSPIELRWFRPISSFRPWRIDKRSHRKILCVDHEIGFTGGVGIAEEWTGDARNPGEWRETHFSIEGPAVAGLYAAFLDNWNEAGEWEIEHPQARFRRWEDGLAVQVVKSNSTVEWTKAASLLRALVCVAQEQILIASPYFVPGATLVELLRDAAGRGVDVQIMLPGAHSDSQLSQLAGYPSVESLLEAGVKIFRYNRTLPHLKVMIIDRTVVSSGSANLNHRSLGKDEECNVNVLSREFAETLAAHFDEDLQHAEAIDPQRWAARPASLKMRENLARMVREQL